MRSIAVSAQLCEHIDRLSMLVYASGNLRMPRDTVQWIESHLDECGNCRSILDRELAEAWASYSDEQQLDAEVAVAQPIARARVRSRVSTSKAEATTAIGFQPVDATAVLELDQSPASGPHVDELVTTPNYVLEMQAAVAVGEQQLPPEHRFDFWLAREATTGIRRLVLAFTKEELEDATLLVERAQRYQRCSYDHPHLLQLLTIGETEQAFYCVAEAPDGDREGFAMSYAPLSLRSVILQEGRIDARRAAAITWKCAEAIGRLHSEGLRGLTLTPESVVFLSGEPKIIDGALWGTPRTVPASAYLPPDGVPDDLYAIGKILYELVTGLPPHEFPRVSAAPRAANDLDIKLAIRVASKACNTDSRKRFGSAAEFARMAEQVALGQKRRWWSRLFGP